MKFFRLLPLLGCLFPTLTFAQLVVEGHVRDESGEKAIESAVVSLLSPTENTLAYRFTDKSGHFIIQYPENRDSLRLSINILGYKTKIIPLGKNNTPLDIRMEVSEFQLKEITVKPPAIYGKEDTVVYNVGAFQTQQDRSIGDILKKLPGIEVAPTGAISHNGKLINRFYIEGVDLLGGKYGIATNNVPAGEVTQVELIERHQPVRMLKDVVISDQSAINLKLKNKKMIRPVGTIKAGVGYEPERLIGTLDAFALQAGQKQQTIVLLKADNAGNDITQELREHYGAETGLESLLNPGQSGSSISSGDNRSLFNKTGIFSLNNLWKTSNDTQLRLNLNYQKDKRDQITKQTNTYFLGDSVLTLHESKTTETENDLLEGVLTYTDNASKHYFNNVLKFKTRWNNSLSEIQNREFFSQQYKITNINVFNTLNYTKKNKKQFWDFSSFARYTSLPEKLIVEADSPDSDARQTVYRSGFYTNNSTYILVPILSSQVKVDLNLEAGLDGLHSDLNRLSLTDSLYNELKTQNVKMQATPSYSYKKNTFTFSISAPFVYHILKVDDKRYDADNSYKNAYFSPNLKLDYGLNAFLRANVAYRYTHTITGSITDFTRSYIQKDYRTLSVNEGLLSKAAGQTVNFNLNFKNPLKGFFFYLVGGYSENKHNLIASQDLDDIFSIGHNLQSDNKIKSWQGSGNIGKTFSDIYTTISLSGNYNLSSSKKIQQGQDYPMQTDVWGLTPSIDSRITEHLVVQGEGSIENTRLKIRRPGIEAPVSSDIRRLSPKLKVFFFPNKKTELKVAGEYRYNEISPTLSTQLYFMDLGFSYKLKQVEWILNWNNIFNQNEYAYTSYNGLDTYYHSIRLRPSNLLVTAVFKY